MAQTVKTETRQKLKQSPQQFLISTMLESTTDELLQLINRETEKNVTLEAQDPREVSLDGTPREDPDAAKDQEEGVGACSDDEEEDGQRDNSSSDNLDYSENDDVIGNDKVGGQNADDDDSYIPGLNTATEDSFRDDLKRQIDELEISAEESFLAYYIIDSLDEDGYLRRDMFELLDDLEFNQHHPTTEEDLEAVLVEIVQEELDPPGIGARNLQECMLLQLQEKKGPVASLCYDIVKEDFGDLSENRWDRIEASFDIQDHQLLVDARRMIRHLNPKPGDMRPVTVKSTSARIQQVHPDFIVRLEDGHLVVSLNEGQVPQVRISKEKEEDLDRFLRMADKNEKEGNKAGAAEKREGARFLREAIQDGNLFISALNQRRDTLMSVMETIVRLQRAYFTTGLDEALQPMTLEDVASRCDYDVSTISRVSNSKFIDTEFGIIPVKKLFTNEVSGSNQTAVINALKQIIDNEDKTHPFTDDALATELSKQGYNIARRTVLKYRELLKIPVARLRKEI